MRVIFGLVLSATLLLSGAAAAAPSNACGRDGESAPLAGTTWKGTFTWEGDPAVAETMTLLPNCVVKYSYKGATYTNGRWLQRGSMITWDTNDHYAIYLGFVEDGEMAGVMANENGLNGSWSYKRAD